MRIARYENKVGSSVHEEGELYCQFTLSDNEYNHLGRPRAVSVTGPDAQGDFRCRPCYTQEGCTVSPATTKAGKEWTFRTWEPVFPGTKIFGAEEVVSALGAGCVEFIAPAQDRVVRVRGASRKADAIKAKVEAAQQLSDADLVAAMRKRLRDNPRWTIVVTEEGRNFEIDTGRL